MNTIDGLTKKQVIRNIKKYNSEVLRFAGKVGAACNDRTRIKWQRQRARAAGFLTDNQERLARFEAVEQNVQRTAGTDSAYDYSEAQRAAGHSWLVGATRRR